MPVFPFLIDTHTHANDLQFANEGYAVIHRALEAGVWIIIVGIDYESSAAAVSIAEQFSVGVYAAVGVHPLRHACNTESDIINTSKLVNFEAFRALVRHPKVVAIGEVGLDFHDIHHGDFNASQQSRTAVLQYEIFSQFLELSREFRLPLLCHARDAHEEMIRLLHAFDQHTRGFDSRGIIHHFTGDWETALRYFNLDFLLSVTPMLSRSQTRDVIFKKTPLSKIVLESECPHLVDPSMSSGRIEPANLRALAGHIAALRGMTLEALARETTRNTLRLCSKILRTMPA